MTRKHLLPYLDMHEVSFQNLLNTLNGGLVHIVEVTLKNYPFSSQQDNLSLKKKPKQKKPQQTILLHPAPPWYYSTQKEMA